MTDEAAARRAEWERLRAERAALRGALVTHLGALEARARDPFGVKAKIRRHPILTAALAAGVGAVLIRLVLPAAPAAAPERRDDAARDATSPVMDLLRTTLMRIAGPWIARFVEEHMGDLEGLLGAVTEGAGAASTVAGSAVAAEAGPASGGTAAPAPGVEPDAAPPDVPVA